MSSTNCTFGNNIVAGKGGGGAAASGASSRIHFVLSRIFNNTAEEVAAPCYFCFLTWRKI